MKCTRQRCQVALRHFEDGPLMPPVAAETTSFTPLRPRRASFLRNAVQKVSASEGPMSMPSTSRRPSVFTPTAMITATGTTRPLLLTFVGGVDPQVRPVALNRAVEERAHALVDLLAEPAHLALRDTTRAERLDEVVDGAGRDARDVGLLHDGGERLLGEPSRLQEAGEVRALAQLRNAQLDRAGAGLPGALPVAVALRQTLGALLAIGRSG